MVAAWSVRVHQSVLFIIVAKSYKSKNNVHRATACITSTREQRYTRSWPWRICHTDTVTNRPKQDSGKAPRERTKPKKISSSNEFGMQSTIKYFAHTHTQRETASDVVTPTHTRFGVFSLAKRRLCVDTNRIINKNEMYTKNLCGSVLAVAGSGDPATCGLVVFDGLFFSFGYLETRRRRRRTRTRDAGDPVSQRPRHESHV